MRKFRLVLTGTFATLALVASGCGTTTSSGGSTTVTDTTTGSDTAADTATDTGPATDATGDVAAAISFSTIYPKMATSCATSGCHTTASTQFAGKLDLSTQDLAYAALVTAGLSDAICTSLKRVKPGDHTNSSLWVRLTSDVIAQPCGTALEKMPYSNPAGAWTAAEVAAVAAWIDAGAAK